MATLTWSALGTESSNIAGTTLDSKSTGTTTFIADIDNTSAKSLYVTFWLVLGSVTPTGNSSIRFALRRKSGSTYAENDSEKIDIPVSTGASAKNLSIEMRLPCAGTFGLYWTNNLNVSSAATGNSLTSRTYNEEAT